MVNVGKSAESIGRKVNALHVHCRSMHYRYNPFFVYCRELALGTVSLTGDRAQGDDNKHDSHYNEWGLAIWNSRLDHLRYFCLVFIMFSRLFIAALCARSLKESRAFFKERKIVKINDQK